MVDKSRFEKIIEFEGKKFGYLKKPWKISENNVRDSRSKLEKLDIKKNLSPSLKEIGMQQSPVVNGKGEIFIGGRRTVGWEMNGEDKLLVEIRDISPLKQMIASKQENETKRDMSPVQEGRLYNRIKDSFGLKQKKIAEMFSITESDVSQKIKTYENSVTELTGDIPYEKVGHVSKTLNYGKYLALLPLESKYRLRMIEQIKEHGMTQKEVRDSVGKSKGVLSLIETYETREQEKKMLEAVDSMLFIKNVDTAKIVHTINNITGSSQKEVTKQVDHDLYSNQEEADKLYFIPRGGRCIGKKVEMYWYGTVDPIKAKEIEDASENETN